LVVDFEFPNEDGKPYKSSGGEMVRWELGEIPIGWRVGTLEECLEHLIDNRGKTPEFFDSGVPALSAKFVKGGDLVIETVLITFPMNYLRNQKN
jgi:type I restriction enzyme S subunit